jgi:CheY-like chemotaxis protein
MLDRSRTRAVEQHNALLVVEDSSVFKGQRRKLEAQGYQVTNAGDAGAALAMARETIPRVIFMSSDSSGSGRTRFLQALRSDDHTRHIPVAAVFADSDHRLERLGLRRVNREQW